MATVNGLTAEYMLELSNANVVSGEVTGDDLILTTRGGDTIDAGNVRGPQGDTGPTGPAGTALDAWPVGSIFMAVVSTNPSDLLGGGTWEAWGTGRVPIAVDTGDSDFNTVEKTGGEKTHTLSTTEIPAHNHGVSDPGHGHGVSDPTHAHGVSDPGHTHGSPNGLAFIVQQGGSLGNDNVPNTGSTHSRASTTAASGTGIGIYGSGTGVSIQGSGTGVSTQNTGGGGAHNNVQPYITCYMWKRTA